jgi:uncharacterized membrane protein YoaT (DUF817 family)
MGIIYLGGGYRFSYFVIVIENTNMVSLQNFKAGTMPLQLFVVSLNLLCVFCENIKTFREMFCFHDEL